MDFKRLFLISATIAAVLTVGQSALAANENVKVRLSSMEIEKLSRKKDGLSSLKNLEVYLGQSFILRYGKLSEDGADARSTKETVKSVFHSSNSLRIIDVELSRGQITKVFVSPDNNCREKSCSLVFEETANSFYLAAVPEKAGYSEITINGQRILDDLGIPSAFRKSNKPEHIYMIGEKANNIRIPLRIKKVDKALIKEQS